jgi:hypothetical protein
LICSVDILKVKTFLWKNTNKNQTPWGDYGWLSPQYSFHKEVAALWFAWCVQIFRQCWGWTLTALTSQGSYCPCNSDWFSNPGQSSNNPMTCSWSKQMTHTPPVESMGQGVSLLGGPLEVSFCTVWGGDVKLDKTGSHLATMREVRFRMVCYHKRQSWEKEIKQDFGTF